MLYGKIGKIITNIVIAIYLYGLNEYIIFFNSYNFILFTFIIKFKIGALCIKCVSAAKALNTAFAFLIYVNILLFTNN
jgi:hypothetical protein